MTPTRSHRLPRSTAFAALILAAGLTALSACAAEGPPAPPVPGGRMKTLELGRYTCELPGDPASPSGNPIPQFTFRVINSSSYTADGFSGSYLYTGHKVVMTGGKLNGLTLHRVSEGLLRKVMDDGSDGDMRCVLTSHS